ncbi:MAG: hypothetical protein AVDCRST_MAG52-2357, partial [uncultured Blastococcus sp.]
VPGGRGRGGGRRARPLGGRRLRGVGEGHAGTV